MRIKEIRALTGLSQRRFADAYGIPVPTLENWERGTRSCPGYVLDLLEFKVKYDVENGGIKTMKKMNWRDHDISNCADDEVLASAYIVFEEDNGKKFYDLCVGIFDDLDAAIAYAKLRYRDGDEPLFVANYSDYSEGNYDYLFSIGD